MAKEKKVYAQAYHKTKGLIVYYDGEYRTPDEIEALKKSKPKPVKKGRKATEEEAS